ncbi:MAG: (Fe-S)-binding protein [Sedimenticola sp.]|nr:(Fe-S)-binding protein [Sedimenticola sp.]
MNDSHLLREADRCVKCGICLPHCPTYKLTLDEGDSPRGRIALIQGLVEGTLQSRRGEAHIDRCLGCLACQKACPSQVNYATLLDGYRATRPIPGRIRLMLHLISRLPYKWWAGAALRAYRLGGIRLLARRIGGASFRRIDDLMPPQSRPQSWRRTNRPISSSQGRVALFTGCVGRITDRPALEAAIALLKHLNYEVAIPDDQGCCGAMHQHGGAPERAAEMAEQNRQAFQDRDYDAVIYLASGCGAQLVNKISGIPVLEISQFLNRCHWPENISLGELDYSVALHTPCSQKHQLQLDDAPHEMLARIPGIQLHRLDEIDCCGAAGSYLLLQPEMSDRLQSRALAHLYSGHADILATSNTGCALQLAAGIRKSGRKIRVMHPVELILESVNKGGPGG